VTEIAMRPSPSLAPQKCRGVGRAVYSLLGQMRKGHPCPARDSPPSKRQWHRAARPRPSGPRCRGCRRCQPVRGPRHPTGGSRVRRPGWREYRTPRPSGYNLFIPERFQSGALSFTTVAKILVCVRSRRTIRRQQPIRAGLMTRVPAPAEQPPNIRLLAPKQFRLVRPSKY
jgi:hypothetical protein